MKRKIQEKGFFFFFFFFFFLQYKFVEQEGILVFRGIVDDHWDLGEDLFEAEGNDFVGTLEGVEASKSNLGVKISSVWLENAAQDVFLLNNREEEENLAVRVLPFMRNLAKRKMGRRSQSQNLSVDQCGRFMELDGLLSSLALVIKSLKKG